MEFSSTIDILNIALIISILVSAVSTVALSICSYSRYKRYKRYASDRTKILREQKNREDKIINACIDKCVYAMDDLDLYYRNVEYLRNYFTSEIKQELKEKTLDEIKTANSSSEVCK